MAQMKLEHNGVTACGTELYLLNMGPQHPSTHGVLRVLLSSMAKPWSRQRR